LGKKALFLFSRVENSDSDIDAVAVADLYEMKYTCIRLCRNTTVNRLGVST